MPENFESSSIPKSNSSQQASPQTHQAQSIGKSEAPAHSEGLSKIALALAKAQAEFVQPEKNKTVEVKDAGGRILYTFDYADYNAIVEAVRGPLSKNGIAFTHLLEQNGMKWELVTMLIHESGQTLECSWPIGSSTEPKALGGSMTYGKRYCLSAITGCVADDDLDAEPENVSNFKDRNSKPENKSPKESQVKVVPKPVASTPTENQITKAANDGKRWASFWVGVKEHGWTQEEVHAKAFEDYKASTLTALTQDQLASLINHIKENARVQS